MNEYTKLRDMQVLTISAEEQKRIDLKDYIKKCEADQYDYEQKLKQDLRRKNTHNERLTYRLFIR